MDVSVIIVNYNTLLMTRSCIDSIFMMTHDLIFEVILIDNASNDGSREFFSKDSRIIYRYSSENLGFGRANNWGIEIAKGRNIFFLNSDTLLQNNAIKILSDYLDCNYLVGACGGNLSNGLGLPSHSFGRYYPSIFWELNILSHNILAKILYGRNVDYNYSNKILEVAHIIGANLMVKKEVLDKVGVFNPIFFMYREETDLCYRIKMNGYKLCSVPSAKIIHLEGKSVDLNNISAKKIQWLFESNKKFLSLYHKELYVRVVLYIQLMTAYSRCFLCNFFKKERKSYWIHVIKCVNKLLN